ncbi:MAG: T9SS type A sorting domain-containing protein [Flavobacteriaceae bacterium]
MKKSWLIILLTLCFKGHATVHQVGATKIYASPYDLYLANSVQDGDTIEIDAETYTGQSALAVWEQNNLLIKGVGGRPHLVANGQYIWGKGIWVLAGNNITVENIEFSGAAVPDQNGAGIRLDGTGLTVRHCYFHDNENGILTSNPYAGDILIEFSEFNHNGYGDGYSHNVYVGHVNSLTFQFNYSHHATVGHNLKSRAKENYVLYNRIMDEQTGNSSRLIDLPNGGLAIVMGNLIMQGENVENSNMLGYGLEGLSNEPPHELYTVNNTFVNKRVASCIFIAAENGTLVANISNNIFAGTGTMLNGTATTMDANYANTTISDLGFVDELNYDYRLTENSPAVNYGTALNPVNGFSLTPDFMYEHPNNNSTRTTINGTIDAGAYEYNPSLSVSGLVENTALLYPNPTHNKLTIDIDATNIGTISVFSALGQFLESSTNTNTIDLSNKPSGVYLVTIKTKNGNIINKTAIKK